jgi:hypothetical protein
MSPRAIVPALLEEPPPDDLRVDRVVGLEVPPLIIETAAWIRQHISAVLVMAERLDRNFFFGETISDELGRAPFETSHEKRLSKMHFDSNSHAKRRRRT